jgi:alkylation response protein AidB-like acyl-CoA dehydrogenase
VVSDSYTPVHDPGWSFLTCLESGRLPPESPHGFPEQDPATRADGDAIVEEVGRFMSEAVDPDELDRTRELPAGFLDRLKASGFLRLIDPPELGGRGAPPLHVFRAIERAASHSVPAGQIMGIQAGVGVPALLPALPPGPLREFVRERIAAGDLSGFADTDQSGQNNRWRRLTARPSADGSSYVLDGEKVFTGNGPVAELLGVSATALDPDRRRLCVCFVDTRSPGFGVVSRIEFMGSHGLPNAALRFDGVRVPREHVLVHGDGDQLSPAVLAAALLGRLYFTGAPAMAVARRCLSWSRDFVSRRRIDDRPLGDYDLIQRVLATTLADVYAMESVAEWTLAGTTLDARPFERLVAKNILVTTAWRVVDRTMSLFGAEGFETADSKARRGAPPVPLERLFRDARGLRIAGNVDFRLDNQAGQFVLSRYLTARPDRPLWSERPSAAREEAGLHARHLDRFHRTCVELCDRYPDRDELFGRQQTLVRLGRVAAELFTMHAVLARVALPGSDRGELAEVYCAAAEERLAALWTGLDAAQEPDFAKVSARWLAGEYAADLSTT